MTQTKLALLLALITLVVLFTVQNVEVVELRFLFWQVALSRALLVLLVFIAGLTVGWILRGVVSKHRP